MQRDLVIRAMAHDREAFAELARLWIDRLFATSRLIIGDNDRAQDATQEALIAAWRDLAALRDPDRFDVWLRRLLLRQCYREARRTRQQRQLEVPVFYLDPSRPDDTTLIADQDEVRRGLRRLAPEDRAILILRFFDDLPMDEVADSLAIPLGTAKSRLHRAIQHLRAALDTEARSVQTSERRLA